MWKRWQKPPAALKVSDLLCQNTWSQHEMGTFLTKFPKLRVLECHFSWESHISPERSHHLQKSQVMTKETQKIGWEIISVCLWITHLWLFFLVVSSFPNLPVHPCQVHKIPSRSLRARNSHRGKLNWGFSCNKTTQFPEETVNIMD